MEQSTGSSKTKERKVLHAALQAGEIQILIGTHALIEDTVVFKNLGLVVIDEQHRFGVAQRAKLWKKNELITKLKSIVEPYIQDEEAFKNLSEETDFVKDLKINSANLVDVILDVEDAFDIRIENDEMEQMVSVKAAMDIVNSKLK